MARLIYLWVDGMAEASGDGSDERTKKRMNIIIKKLNAKKKTNCFRTKKTNQSFEREYFRTRLWVCVGSLFNVR